MMFVPTQKSLPRLALSLLAPATFLAASGLSAGTARAASLEGPISGWEQGNEPGNISMHIYVPDNPADNPPILVLLHYCGSNASGVFGQANGGGMVSAADQNGFILLVPSTTLGCWDVATPQSLTHDGGGHTGAIVHMIEHTVSQYGANPDRVYAVGTSGGAMAMQGLLAVYPDVFKAGSGFSGVPAGCWAVNNADGSWSSPCANGEVTHTAEEWGDIVRDMYPGYDGFRPRVQIYHGNADSTISFTNHTEAVKEWTNVHGLDETPDETGSVNIGGTNFNREEWIDECGNVLLDVLTEPGGPHNTSANMNGQEVITFLSLDVPGDEDPYAASDCAPSGDGGGSGTGGADAGTGGADGGGGDTGAGGTATGGMDAGAGGAMATGGAAPGAGGAAPAAGGATTGVGGTDPGPGTTGGSMNTDGGGSSGDSGGCSLSQNRGSRPWTPLLLGALVVGLFARRRTLSARPRTLSAHPRTSRSAQN